MSVNRSQEYMTKSYSKTNGVHRPQSDLIPVSEVASVSKQAFSEKATDFIRHYPAPVLIGGFVIGGLLGWFASRSR